MKIIYLVVLFWFSFKVECMPYAHCNAGQCFEISAQKELCDFCFILLQQHFPMHQFKNCFLIHFYYSSLFHNYLKIVNLINLF